MQDQSGNTKSGNNPNGAGGFQKGQSGNPGGRAKMPPEIRNMLEAKAQDAVKVYIKHLDDTDPRVSLKAAELLLDRTYGKPQPTAETIRFALPEDSNTAAALVALHCSLLHATARGEIGVGDAREMSALFENHRRLIEVADLESRIAKLESNTQRT